MGDNQVGEIQNLTPSMPQREILERIHAYDQAKCHRPEFSTQRNQRVQSVGAAGTPYFPLVHAETVDPGDCQLEHLHSLPGARSRRVTVWWAGAGDKPQFAELRPRLDLERRSQMAMVHRIEGAPKNPDSWQYRRIAGATGRAQVRTCPSPITTYFSVVKPTRPTGPRTWSLLVLMPISAPRPNS